MRQILAIVSVIFAATLAGCSSSSNETGSSPVETTTTDPRVASTVTVPISSSSRSASLAGVASINFGSDASLDGTSVTIAQVRDANLDKVALSEGEFLDVSFPGSATIEITLSKLPSQPVSIDVSAADQIKRSTGSDVATIYSLSVTDDSLSEGEGGFSSATPLASKSASATGIVAGQLNWYDFQPDGKGAFVARVRVGSAKGVEPAVGVPTSKARSLAADSTTAAVILACPFSPPAAPTSPNMPDQSTSTVRGPPCIETSRFNPVRSIGRYGYPRPHKGMDLRAAAGTPIYLPAGGVPNTRLSVSRKQYVASGSPRSGTGVMLTVDYGSYRIRVMHLNDLDPSLLTENGDIVAAPIAANQIVARTGGTGAGADAPHLHYELMLKQSPSCTDSSARCLAVGAQTDPFPYIATNFRIEEASFKTELKVGTAYEWQPKASDVYGVEVSSDVGNAQENGGQPPAAGGKTAYDPTRKVCVWSEPSSTLNFSAIAGSFPGRFASTCAPWTRKRSATGVAATPDTIVKARYSRSPEVSVSEDTLSDNSATWYLSVPAPVVLQPICFGKTMEFTAPGQHCYQTWTDDLTDPWPGIPANTIILRSSDPEIVSASMHIDDATTWTITYTSGRKLGKAYVQMFSSSAYLYTADFINQNGYGGSP